jgi:hypothetical protein
VNCGEKKGQQQQKKVPTENVVGEAIELTMKCVVHFFCRKCNKKTFFCQFSRAQNKWSKIFCCSLQFQAL